MSGNCYSCAASFGIFKKELGCKNCGFAFCKNCLTKKVPIPKLKNEKHKVCNKCFNILTGNAKAEDVSAKHSPPAAYLKRIAALEQRQHQPQTTPASHAVQSSSKTNMTKYRGMSKEDIALAKRLEALKENRKQGKDQRPVPSQKEMEERLAKLKKDGGAPPPSSDEMAERLARLKGTDPGTVNKPHLFPKDKRSQQQQVDDLLDEIADEVNIDSFNYGVGAEGRASGLENNLNKEGGELGKPYEKNIFPMVSGPQEGVNGSRTESNTDLAEVQRLMESVAKEMELDAQRALQDMQKDKELMERLQNLKQKDESESQTIPQMDSSEGAAMAADDSTDDENDEEVIKRIIKQHLEEVKLEDELRDAGITSTPAGAQVRETQFSANTFQEQDEDDFPWCCICNENAAWRCFDCDGDLYCKRCFSEGHDKMDLKEHRKATFKPPS